MDNAERYNWPHALLVTPAVGCMSARLITDLPEAQLMQLRVQVDLAAKNPQAIYPSMNCAALDISTANACA